ncbi:MAG: hypothetical protein OXB97_08290 [Rhodospirillales bacterium]|nr:hypothetical protein [Rhodospirillales bacterium]
MTGTRAFIALAGFMMACGARADYLAYSVGEESRLPLPESIDAIEARYLVNLQWGDFDGARTRVAVLEVDNTSSATSFQAVGADGESVTWETQHANMVPVNGIEAIVTDVMNRSGRFRLVERQALSSILSEQDLVTAERISAPSGAATGNVLGARFLVQAVVTDYEANVSRRSAGGLGGALTNRLPAVIGAVGVRSGLGRVGMNFRLIDAETSEIVYTKQIESIIRERGLMFGGLAFGGSGALGGFFSNYARTPIGQAVIAGVNKGIYELVKNIGAEAASGSVVRADGNQLYVNLGQGVVAAGDELRIISKGEDLIDPETGISLGSLDTEIGSARVVNVQEQFSIAELVSSTGSPSRGDLVVSTAPPPGIEFAEGWSPP